jgi:2-polyprenyl-3-methyl-5-hydroxy-6-metoxy-1,4-benzoquinol methylase
MRTNLSEREHFLPSAGLDLDSYLKHGDIAGVHHVIRYLWAIEVIANGPQLGSVLDVACGSGYGSAAIAQRFPHLKVLGVDIDPTATKHAQKNYRRSNLRFKVGDVCQWEATIGSELFDCIISFDTIEHISHREIMLQNIVDHMHPDSFLLLSTPANYEPKLHPDWSAHRIEYSFLHLYDFLHRYFGQILRPEDSSLPQLQVFDRLKGSPVSYWLNMNPLLCQDPIQIDNPYGGAQPAAKKPRRSLFSRT